MPLSGWSFCNALTVQQQTHRHAATPHTQTQHRHRQHLIPYQTMASPRVHPETPMAAPTPVTQQKKTITGMTSLSPPTFQKTKTVHATRQDKTRHHLYLESGSQHTNAKITVIFPLRPWPPLPAFTRHPPPVEKSCRFKILIINFCCIRVPCPQNRIDRVTPYRELRLKYPK